MHSVAITHLQILLCAHADIICFQETKLTKADFDRDLALIDGWCVQISVHAALHLHQLHGLILNVKCRHSFFSFYRHKSRGYSGVATFCRAGVAVPLAAQEGFTGAYPGSFNQFVFHGPCASPQLLPKWCCPVGCD